MKMTFTLARYLVRTYLLNLVYLLLALLAIIYLFDTVELLRRASKYEDVTFMMVLQMGLLKLPEVGQVLFPFVVLFSGMYTFWQLTRRSELVVVRSAGFSVWQFLTPILFVAVAIGILQMMVINPVGSVFLSKFDHMEQKYLKRGGSEIAVFKEGLWLRQAYKNGEEKGYVILHAPRVDQTGWVLQNPTVLFFDFDDTFFKRLDARKASLGPGRWLFEDVQINNGNNQVEEIPHYVLQTSLTIQDVEDSFSSPDSMSFWRLPAHIKILENAGFSAARLRVHYNTLLAQPLMLAAMILLAATVSMRSSRMKGGAYLFALGIFMGFVIFFLSSFLQAMGVSGQIPVVLAAWSPALISTLIGVSVLMRLEDG